MKEVKEIILKLATLLALTINTLGFVLVTIYGTEGFTNKFYIVWGLSLVWIIVFIYANCFHKVKKSNKVTVETNKPRRSLGAILVIK